MRKLKTLKDIYIQRKTITKGTLVYFRLHVLTNQIERLMHTKQGLLETLEDIDGKLACLKQHYDRTKKEIEQAEVKNDIKCAEKIKK